MFAENKEKEKLKPRFMKKRKTCPECGSTKWTLRKLPKKKNETQHWRGTCKKCHYSWPTDSGKEYWYVDPRIKQTKELGAPM